MQRKPLTPEKLSRMSFYLPPELVGRIRDAALKARVTQGQLVAEAVEHYLKTLERKHGKLKAQLPRAYSRHETLTAKQLVGFGEAAYISPKQVAHLARFMGRLKRKYKKNMVCFSRKKGKNYFYEFSRRDK